MKKAPALMVMLALLLGLTAGAALASPAAVSGMVVPEDAAAEKGRK